MTIKELKNDLGQKKCRDIERDVWLDFLDRRLKDINKQLDDKIKEYREFCKLHGFTAKF